jgi:hypothetical protein
VQNISNNAFGVQMNREHQSPRTSEGKLHRREVLLSTPILTKAMAIESLLIHAHQTSVNDVRESQFQASLVKMSEVAEIRAAAPC